MNIAAARAFDLKAISSASVMVPCPWFSEVIQMAQERPDWDIGIHLTVTSEWDYYRWRPIASAKDVSTLVEADGCFFRKTADLKRNASLQQLKCELRAQIDLALRMGLKPTHIDSHMFALLQDHRFMLCLESVAHEYGLPYLTLEPSLKTPAILQIPEHLIESALKDEAVWAAWYLGSMRTLRQGISQLIVHLGLANTELAAITDPHKRWGASWREMDYKVILSDAFRRAVSDENITVTDWGRQYS